MGALIRSNCSAVSMMLGCRFLLLLVGLAALSHAKSYSKRNFLTTLGFLKKKLSVDQEKQDPSSGSGSLDPSSGSGEIPCMFKCSEAEFVNILFRCDGYRDCSIGDGSGKDEEDCENYTYDISSRCGGFQCATGEVIPDEYVCDDYPDCQGDIMCDDCPNCEDDDPRYGTDEKNCEDPSSGSGSLDPSSGSGESGFQCATGEVIPDEWVCDEYPDCRGDITCDDYPNCEDVDPIYGEDEKNCEDPSSGSGGLTFGAKNVLKKTSSRALDKKALKKPNSRAHVKEVLSYTNFRAHAKNILRKPISQALAKEDLRKTISRARAKEAFMRATHKRKEAKKSH